MFGKLGDMMGKLQEMKQRADEIKSKLSSTIIHIEGAGGDIQLEMTGYRELKSLKLSDAIQHGDKVELEKHLLLTINNALKQVEDLNESEMKKAASGMLPGV